MPQYLAGDLRPNPFRHIDRYPIRREKVTALRESMRTTGIWPTMIGRLVAGNPELAFGHHRKTAIIEEFGAKVKVELTILPLSDEDMLQIMARENMEEWGTSAMVEHETVRAVVEAYAEGKIALPPPEPKARGVRNAPGFVSRADGRHPYSAQTVADFLGWTQPNGSPQDKVGYALAALQFIEEGVLSESDFEGLSTKQAEAVVKQARQARAADEAVAARHRKEAEQAAERAERAERDRLEAEQREREAADREEARRATEARRRAEEERDRAKQEGARVEKLARERKAQGQKRATTAGRAVSTSLRSGEKGYREAASVAREALPKEDTPPPNIDDFARRLAADLTKILAPDRDERAGKLAEVVRFREHMRDFEREDLARTLDGVSGRATDYAKQLRSRTKKVQTPTRRQLEEAH